ncbi:hypothetical protein PAPYR_2258 [Paratrimastix pyriformis]|uniref:Uncharacterized protein n=1 Tax=Paratrimastix pyriformis TaxID=342808 RepID=A0ABQ8UPY3_9EUKA|nr:hypothetical protein PAPYR_2258 [Paratrimastix pyriformis]
MSRFRARYRNAINRVRRVYRTYAARIFLRRWRDYALLGRPSWFATTLCLAVCLQNMASRRNQPDPLPLATNSDCPSQHDPIWALISPGMSHHVHPPEDPAQLPPGRATHPSLSSIRTAYHPPPPGISPPPRRQPSTSPTPPLPAPAASAHPFQPSPSPAHSPPRSTLLRFPLRPHIRLDDPMLEGSGGPISSIPEDVPPQPLPTPPAAPGEPPVAQVTLTRWHNPLDPPLVRPLRETQLASSIRRHSPSPAPPASRRPATSTGARPAPTLAAGSLEDADQPPSSLTRPHTAPRVRVSLSSPPRDQETVQPAVPLLAMSRSQPLPALVPAGTGRLTPGTTTTPTASSATYVGLMYTQPLAKRIHHPNPTAAAPTEVSSAGVPSAGVPSAGGPSAGGPSAGGPSTGGSSTGGPTRGPAAVSMTLGTSTSISVSSPLVTSSAPVLASAIGTDSTFELSRTAAAQPTTMSLPSFPVLGAPPPAASALGGESWAERPAPATPGGASSTYGSLDEDEGEAYAEAGSPLSGCGDLGGDLDELTAFQQEAAPPPRPHPHPDLSQPAPQPQRQQQKQPELQPLPQFQEQPHEASAAAKAASPEEAMPRNPLVSPTSLIPLPQPQSQPQPPQPQPANSQVGSAPTRLPLRVSDLSDRRHPDLATRDLHLPAFGGSTSPQPAEPPLPAPGGSPPPATATVSLQAITSASGTSSTLSLSADTTLMLAPPADQALSLSLSPQPRQHQPRPALRPFPSVHSPPLSASTPPPIRLARASTPKLRPRNNGNGLGGPSAPSPIRPVGSPEHTPVRVLQATSPVKPRLVDMHGGLVSSGRTGTSSPHRVELRPVGSPQQPLAMPPGRSGAGGRGPRPELRPPPGSPAGLVAKEAALGQLAAAIRARKSRAASTAAVGL